MDRRSYRVPGESRCPTTTRSPTIQGDDTDTMADTLTITDNRTGKQYEIPIKDGAIRATDLRQIKLAPDDFGLMTYDPAFMNTAACRSAITYIDGDKGILLLPRLPDRAAGRALRLPGDGLPDPVRRAADRPRQLAAWIEAITRHTMLHENVKKLMEGFQYDAHPMGIFISTVGALSTLYRDAKQIFDAEARSRQCAAADRQGARASPPTRTATASAAPTSTPTTTSASPATS